MSTQANEDLVRRGYQAFSAGDTDTLRQLMAPDVVHSVPGNNSFSGEHRGLDDVLGMYGRLFEHSGGTLKVELEDVRAQGENQVVSTHHSTAEREGKQLDIRESITFTIADGKVTRLEENTDDLEAADDFWS